MTANTLFESFLTHVVAAPQAVALVGSSASRDQTRHGDEAAGSIELSWAQLAEAVRRTAARLQAVVGPRGAGRDFFGHSSDNRICDVILAIAIESIGATEVPFDARLPSEMRDRLWQRFDGTWISEAFKQGLLDSCRDVAAERARGCDFPPPLEPPARGTSLSGASHQVVLWTTGTTSDPKGVVLSQRSLFSNATAKLRAVPQATADTRLTSLPLSHAYARTCDFGTWLLSGCRLVVGRGYSSWASPGPGTSLGVRHPPTLANVTPALARRLFESRENPEVAAATGRLRILGCGGAAMRADDFQYWTASGTRVVQGYGMTEAGPVICSATPESGVPGLVGRPVDGWETRIVGGELFVRGPHLMDGYWRDPDATRAKINPDGWMATGDLVAVDSPTGQLRIGGRKDDVMVLPNGLNVHPAAVESIAVESPPVRHALVRLVGAELRLWVDIADADWTPGLCQGLRREIAARLPPWSHPVAIDRFEPPLAADRGELTIKGTLRRNQVIKNRWPHAR